MQRVTSFFLRKAPLPIIRRRHPMLSADMGFFTFSAKTSATGADIEPNSQSKTESSTNAIELDSLRTEVATKEAQLKDLKNSYLMALADMENLRQRTKREVEAASQFAIQRFCKDIIGVADILEMALASKATTVDGGKKTATLKDDDGRDSQLREGIQMTLEELHRIFARHGVTPIDPLHQRFDPNLHNALYEVPLSSLPTLATPSSTVDEGVASRPSIEPGMIVNVQKKGYLLHHRVIRPADVGVARKD